METLQRTANRGSISTGFDIANSVKLEPDNAEFLKRNQADGNRKTWTYSMWVKRTELGMSAGMALFYAGVYHHATRIFFDAGSDAEKLTIDLASEANIQYRWITNRLFRDTSAWYHFVWRVDTTQSTATDRMRMYVNGVLLTADDFQQTATFPQNTDTTANKSNLGGQQQMAIGNYSWANNNGIYAGYAAQCALVDGESLAPTEFGEFDDDTGIWKPKDISGLNYGTGNNSFLLDFETASDLGANAKGNDVNFSLNNITSANQATDTPTNNFAIPNVIGTTRTNKFTYTEGGTKVVSAGSTDWDSWANTIAVGNGKWYAEFKIINTGNYFVGVGSEEYYFVGAGNGTGWPEIYYGYSGTNSVGFYNSNGDIYNNGTQVVIGTTYTANDIISVALDMDNGKVYFAKNGTYIDSQNPVTGTNAQNLPDTEARYFIGTTQYQANLGVECNYGGYTTTSIASGNADSSGYGTFEYAPPSGYYALCTKNLAEYG